MAQQRRRTASRSSYSRSSGGARASQRSSKKRGGGGGLAGLLIVLLLLAAVAVVGIMSVKDLYSNRIVEGIVLQGVDLKGMTRDEAYVALSNKVNEDMSKINLTIRHGDRQWSYDSSQLKANNNLNEIVDQVAKVGHEGSIKQRMDEAKMAKAGHYNNLAASFGIDNSVIGYFVDNVKAEIDKPAVEPSYNFDPTKYGQAEFDAGEDPKIMFSFTDGIAGIEVDKEATVNAIKADLEGDFSADVQIITRDIQPTTSAQAVKDSIELLYHSSTRLARLPDGKPNVNRNHNIELAMSFFDGITIMPDQAVSYNITIGERTEAAGFREAGVIGRDKTLVDALGGGICQGATTLYRAAFFAGCEITDWSPHSWPAYLTLGDDTYAYGMDAMVNWGTDDLVFVNRSNAPMYINFYLWKNANGEPRYVDIDIYGAPLKDGMTIGYDNSDHETVEAPEPEYKPDTENKFPDEKYNAESNQMEYVYRKSRKGHTVNVYRLWKKDGQVVEKEFMHTAVYQPIKGLIYTKPAPEVPPGTDPNQDAGAVG